MMYNKDIILKKINSIKLEVEAWENELKSKDKDLLKFYKKGHKRAGIRLRRQLNQLIKEIQVLRLDIKRLYKERDIFKGTEFDKDFKGNRKIKPPTD